ncbi:GNAT family N-acetyltransferase [Streptomyces sp. MUSC 14]|uniref:GNAT family N-acetyltransferase n=1 Tax=Streptomyces sp. MUSC 14 TaxID=1354889 RepID=UPI0008F59B18|nr:GNAT family N-acetyltransferase [Streptomyces sp. MUSC 14]OIK02838.1 GNAT family N-acetyltransferase [Streptomyces sp. MUSC 14]
MSREVRPFRTSDLETLVEVSIAADTLFAEHGLLLPPDDPAQTVREAEHVFVTGEPVVGFTTVTTVDGNLHLAQLSVHPKHGRQGLGGLLLDAVVRHGLSRGLPAITLTTFRDVPFNAPWYRARGFADLDRSQWGPDLQRVWQEEAEAGVEVAPRIAMSRPLADHRAEAEQEVLA